MKRPHFNGSDYKPEHDLNRLTLQHDRVKNAMIDQKWRTLEEISIITNDPPASISAQLRHLRKPRFGGWKVEKRSRGERDSGLFEYRLIEGDDQFDLNLSTQDRCPTCHRKYPKKNKKKE